MLKKSIILFIIATLMFSFLVGCKNESPTIDDCRLNIEWFSTTPYYDFHGFIEKANNGVYNGAGGEYLIFNNIHMDGTHCSEIRVVDIKTLYGDYYNRLILMDFQNYQYRCVPAENYISGTTIDEIVIEISKSKNSFYDENEREFYVIGEAHDNSGAKYYYKNIYYLEQDGYLITIALPEHIVFSNEEELKQHFTFETHTIRECEVCKVANQVE